MNFENVLHTIFSENFTDALGWTLMHSLWQGALIALGLALVMVSMRRYRSRTRYHLGMVAMVLMLVVSMVTFTVVYGSATGAESGLLAREGIAPAAQNTGNTALSTVETFKDYFHRHLPLIVTIWLMGVLVLMLRLTGGILYNRRLKTRFSQPLPSSWQKRLNAIGRKIGVEKSVSLLESASIKAPMVIGYFKPVVLVPVGLVTGLPREQVEALLAHELAHIFRSDYLMNIFQNVIDMLYFYHPGLRWISSMVRVERENCCDDMAVSAAGDSLVVARALANVQVRDGRGGWNPEPAVAATGGSARLFNRVKRLLKPLKPASRFREGLGGALLVLFCMLTLAVGIDAAAAVTMKDTFAVEAANNVGRPAADTQESEEDKEKKAKQKEEEKELKKEQKEKEKAAKKALKEEEKRLKKLKKEQIRRVREELRVREREFRKQDKVREREVLRLKRALVERVREAKHSEDEKKRELRRMEDEIKAKVNDLDAHREELEDKVIKVKEKELQKVKEELAKRQKELQWNAQERKRELQLAEEQLIKRSLELKRVREVELKRAQLELEHERQRLIEAETKLKKEQVFLQKITDLLLQDKLIKDPDHFELRLTKKALYINGVKQPKKVYKKYKELVEKAVGKLEGSREFKINRN
jgi:beta-lactamase regulating signal transducer with metallopeptidase domain